MSEEQTPAAEQRRIGRCAECGHVVVIDGARFTRLCSHETAAVTVDLQASAHGVARLAAAG